MNELELRQALDACRPGSDDLNLPEFAELANRVGADVAVKRAFEATQKLDLAVREALEDVPVPTGLAERLLASAAAANGEGNTEPAGKVGLAERALRERSAREIGPRGARPLELLAPLVPVLLCAASLFLVVWISTARPITTEQLVERSFDWKSQLDHEAWNESFKNAPREDFPLGRRATIGPWRWQHLRAKGGGEMVVYYGGPPDVLLFVVRSPNKVEGLSNSPKLLSTTGGWSVGAWQSGDLTYVLVVEGDRRKFESHLRTQVPV